MRELRTILTSREQQYARAETCVDTPGISVKESLSALLRALAR